MSSREKCSRFLSDPVFLQSKYDKAEVLEYQIIFRVNYNSMLSLEVTQCRKNFNANMVIKIVCHFSDEGWLLCLNIVFDVGYIR